ncbi:hypothetical protein [Bradyrhizobium arachidis]|uniref:hypothetical protein n=1 Tax=Bradyrhizobium arachidis TaxID=858423 RepID=UPI0008EBBA12|nr:hypothetical protein [Bradyrhizobium arachidis]SFV00882.1 hypothetical protein SAMN05192541_109270 [Bradyrhizobium arachidis]
MRKYWLILALALLSPARAISQVTPSCPISDRPQPSVIPSPCGTPALLCGVNRCSGFDGVICLVSFGLYRGTGGQDVGDFRCPPRHKLYSPLLGWVRPDDIIARYLRLRSLRFNNNYLLQLDDDFSDALKNLTAKSTDTSTPFWLIIKNTNATPVNFLAYTLISDTPLDNVYDDNDRVLWEKSDRIFSSLREYKQVRGHPEPFSLTINPGTTVLAGIYPNVTKATKSDGYYPVGLFSAQLKNHFQLETGDILALGLIPGRR